MYVLKTLGRLISISLPSSNASVDLWVAPQDHMVFLFIRLPLTSSLLWEPQTSYLGRCHGKRLWNNNDLAVGCQNGTELN
jgi:hypothetical protein